MVQDEAGLGGDPFSSGSGSAFSSGTGFEGSDQLFGSPGGFNEDALVLHFSQHGIERGKVDALGRTPLHYAVLFGPMSITPRTSLIAELN